VSDDEGDKILQVSYRGGLMVITFLASILLLFLGEWVAALLALLLSSFWLALVLHRGPSSGRLAQASFPNTGPGDGSSGVASPSS
jgi:hypothetical protein